MKFHPLPSLLFALAVLPLGTTRAAVNPAIVPADARWVIYADLNALRGSVIGKELVAFAEKAQLETPGGKIGIDWQKLLATIGSATAYGSNLSPNPNDIDGTLVLQGTPDLRKIAESLLIQANLANPTNVVEITDLPFPAYEIKGNPPPAKPVETAKPADDAAAPATAKAEVKEKVKAKRGVVLEPIIAFPPEPIVIVSKSKAQILKAREVFRGNAPSLAKGSGSPMQKFIGSGDNAYLFAACTIPADQFFPDDGPQARIFKMTSSGSLAIGERGPDAFAHAELIASSGQMADKLQKILQGMTAMMSLAETNDKQLGDFLNSAVVNREGDVVTLDLSYASARLAQMIANARQQSQSPDRAAPRPMPMLNGRALAEWNSEAQPASADAATPAAPAPLATRMVENVALKNGTLLTLARSANVGRNIKFDRVEITPVEGGGAPLVFRPEFMRVAGPRANWLQFPFPGADGNYTVKVSYVNDPAGKATFALSARDPKTPATDADAKK
jgi:hypothetical protein